MVGLARTHHTTTARRRGIAAGLVTTLTALGMLVTGAMESSASELSSGQPVVLRGTWSPPGSQIILNVTSATGRTKQTGVTLQSFSDANGASYMGFCLFPFVFDDFTWPLAVNNSSSFQAVTLDEHVSGTQDASGVAGNLRQIRWLMNNVPDQIRNRTASSSLLGAFEAAFWHYAENATVRPAAGVSISEFTTYYQQFTQAADASSATYSYSGMVAQPRSAAANLQSVALVPVVMPTTRPAAVIQPAAQRPTPEPLPVSTTPTVTGTAVPATTRPPAMAKPGKITTTAITNRAQNKTFACTATTITDIVKYQDLPLDTLTLHGELMDKATGKSTGIKAKKAFRPTSSQGEVRLDFRLSDAQAARWCATSLVAFEVVMQPIPAAPSPDDSSHNTMTAGATRVAQHRDINSASQTVHGVKTTVQQPITPAPTHPVLPHTGTNPALRLIGLAGFNMLLVGTVFLLAGQKRSHPVRYSSADF